MVYIHSGILLKHKKNSFAATWMDLDSIMLSEKSQTEKDKYTVCYHLYVESKKNFNG